MLLNACNPMLWPIHVVRLGALGLIALTFPNQPNASMWLKQAVFEFRWMLANGVMEDGQWHEPSTRCCIRVL